MNQDDVSGSNRCGASSGRLWRATERGYPRSRPATGSSISWWTTTSESTVMPRKAKLLTVAEVAALFQVHPQTVRLWVREGYLPARRVGLRLLRFDSAAVTRFGATLVAADALPREEAS